MSSKKAIRKAKITRERRLKDRLVEAELLNSRLRSFGVDLANRANYAVNFWRNRALLWKKLAKKYYICKVDGE